MRALVIGAGRMGSFHRRALLDLGLSVWTVDPDPRAGADYLRVPRRGVWDVVVAAVPMGCLAETAAGWAGFGGRLLVEKPFAASLEEARQLEALLGGQRVAVGYVERFNPRVLELRERLAGSVPFGGRFVRWNDRPSADVLVDLRSHDVDLARFLDLETATFDTRAGSAVRRREVYVETAHGPLWADLLAHDTSPLHRMWRGVLAPDWARGEGGGDVARPYDAVMVLEALAARTEVVA